MSSIAGLRPAPTGSRPVRWLFAGLGVACVGLGAVGVFVPGLPTTVFLIAASWLFTRSCPWLEDRLIRVPLFRPFLAYLRPDAPMPRRAVLTTLVVMWAAVALSAGLMLTGEERRLVVAAVIAAAGVVGTFFVIHIGRRRGAFSGAQGAESSFGPTRAGKDQQAIAPPCVSEVHGPG